MNELPALTARRVATTYWIEPIAKITSLGVKFLILCEMRESRREGVMTKVLERKKAALPRPLKRREVLLISSQSWKWSF